MFQEWTDQITEFLGEVLKASHGPSPPSGLHHFSINSQGANHRVHLRVDQDGHGTLLVDANRFIHLNPTATLMAFDYLSGRDEQEVMEHLVVRYQVTPHQAAEDYRRLTTDLETFMASEGKAFYALSKLEVKRPFSRHPSAPYRMDLALTYRCNNDCPHCYNARERDFPELTTREWKTILNQLWEHGIPHVVFTGGEPTLREDLPQLIAHAENLGQITGLNTNGRRLATPGYVEKLVDAGLDHLQITVESHDPEVHDNMVHTPGAWKQTIAGLKRALSSRLYVMTNTTMLKGNQEEMGTTLDYLARCGVPTLGLNALIHAGRGKEVDSGLSEEDLLPLLELAKSKTEIAGQRLIWYTPTPYCNFNPLDLDLGVKSCTAALYNMCIEPDGNVLPCQSYYRPLGHFLEDPWHEIWNHPLAVSIRERNYAPEPCQDCKMLPECGAGCPLSLAENAQFMDPENLIPVRH